MKQIFDVVGMTCSACSARVDKATRSVSGVESVAVNLLKNSMEVTYEGDPSVIAEISAAVSKAGYQAIPRPAIAADMDRVEDASNGSNGYTTSADAMGGVVGNAAQQAAQAAERSVKVRLIVSVLFTVPLF